MEALLRSLTRPIFVNSKLLDAAQIMSMFDEGQTITIELRAENHEVARTNFVVRDRRFQVGKLYRMRFNSAILPLTPIRSNVLRETRSKIFISCRSHIKNINWKGWIYKKDVIESEEI